MFKGVKLGWSNAIIIFNKMEEKDWLLRPHDTREDCDKKDRFYFQSVMGYYCHNYVYVDCYPPWGVRTT